MPIPPGFGNLVRRVNATPVAAADINTELATQNAAGYWATDLKFLDANNAFLLFVKNDTTAYGYTADQKVNAVSNSQAAIDADLAAEEPGGYYATGVFPAPDGTLYLLYQQLDPVLS